MKWPRPVSGGWCLALLAGMGEAVGVAAGLDDVGAVGEPVDDRGAEPGVGEGFRPAIRGWHMLRSGDPGWCLGCLPSGVPGGL